MSEIGIVLVSLLGGAVLITLLAGVAYLAWQSFSLRKTQAEIRALIAGNLQETKSALDAAKSSFSTIRSETKSILEEHRKAMQAGIASINAEALTTAAVRCFEGCQRLEKAIAVFQRLILENTDQRTPGDYAPEETAPERNEFGGPPSGYSVGLTAAYDAEADEGGEFEESRTAG